VPTISQKTRILYVHSNSHALARRLHSSRVSLYNQLGYDVRLFDTTQHFSPTIFPYLDRRWKRRDPELMKFYEALEPELDRCELLIHYNGGNIHPAYLKQFNCMKVYHCADDPDASSVLSEPVAREYDVCAISNVACLDQYRAWGCRHVFFWPLGSSFPDDVIASFDSLDSPRDIELVFVGSKYGASSVRFFGRLLGMYKRRRFMEAIEREVPGLVAYGAGWKNGYIDDERLPALYARSSVGVNKHNSIGPVNFRLFDLAAFGVMQICDNRRNLGAVYRLDEEIVGYETLEECLALISHYIQHPEDARRIAAAARKRFAAEYSSVPLWENFVRNLNTCLAERDESSFQKRDSAQV
jgi:spore maturation protein CgeB